MRDRAEAWPLEAHGVPVQTTDARLFRESWAEGKPLRVLVRGTHVDPGTTQHHGFVVEDREELGRLIAALTSAYASWPR